MDETSEKFENLKSLNLRRGGVREAEIGVLKEKLREIGVEIENERDDLRVELDVHIEETSGLRLKLVEVERRERKTEEEVQKMKVEYSGVMEEREED